MDQSIEQLLAQAPANLPFSYLLKKHFRKQNYKTLAQILEHKIAIILKQPGFTVHMLHEYLEFLKANNIQHLLKE